MKSINQSRISTAMVTALASLVFLSTTIAFSPAPLPQQHLAHSSRPSSTITAPLQMSFADVSDFYAQFPLQAAVLTCGVKASVADGIAQVRTTQGVWDDLEFRRNLAYILYGGIFIGAFCHYEYDVIFPILFGTDHSLFTAFKEVLFDNFVSAPLAWLPPAYFIKAIVYDYPLQEGLQMYIDDVTKNDLLRKYWTIWLPAQSISFTVIPDHLRIVFMATVSFFWFILFSTLSSASTEVIEAEKDCQFNLKDYCEK
ncbi:hypothetical protein ACHAXR_011547 [Thalassiosira sp. AJA248-18]